MCCRRMFVSFVDLTRQQMEYSNVDCTLDVGGTILCRQSKGTRRAVRLVDGGDRFWCVTHILFAGAVIMHVRKVRVCSVLYNHHTRLAHDDG